MSNQNEDGGDDENVMQQFMSPAGESYEFQNETSRAALTELSLLLLSYTAQKFLEIMTGDYDDDDDDDDDDEDDEGGDVGNHAELEKLRPPKSVIDRKILVPDGLQKVELVNRGVNLIEDTLFDKPNLNRPGGYTYLDYINEISERPLNSLVGTMGVPTMLNAIDKLAALIEELKSSIKADQQLYEANISIFQSSEEAARIAKANMEKKIAEAKNATTEYKNRMGDCQSYRDEALKSMHKVQDGTASLDVTLTVLNGLNHIKKLHREQPQQLPYIHCQGSQLRGIFAVPNFEVVKRLRQRVHVFVARASALFGFHLSNDYKARARGQELIFTKDSTSELVQQTCTIFDIDAPNPDAKKKAKKTSSKKRRASAGTTSLASPSPKKRAALIRFARSPEGQQFLQHGLAAVSASASAANASSTPGSAAASASAAPYGWETNPP